MVTTHTINLIKGADLVVVDLTGQNPNVFYEMAVAHGFRRPAVHIQEHSEETPFNVRGMRVLRYNLSDLNELEEAQRLLAQYAKNATENERLTDNPLSAAGRFLELQQSGNPVMSGVARLTETVEDLRADLRRAFTSGFSTGQRTGVGESAVEIGISRISMGGLGGTELINRLRKSRLVRIISTSGVHLIETYTSALVEALANGCDIRLMLPEPESAFVEDVEMMEEKELGRARPTRIADEIRSVRLTLCGALQDASDLAARERNVNPIGSISVGRFSTHFRSTMVLCDETWGWLTLTLPPARSTDSPAFALSNSGSRPLLRVCQSHFDFTWQILLETSNVESITA
jgi:hypothetical protein